MKNTMKKIQQLSMLLLLGVLLISCKKDQIVWTKDSGYTMSEILGTYSYSKVDNAFEGLTESPYCHICYDAQITITPSNLGKVKFEFKSSGANFTRNIVGNPNGSSNDFLMCMVDGRYELTATVYTNNANEIRLHGHVRNNSNDSPINYYFDVIKN